MYGALDVAEQVNWATGADYFDDIRAVTKSPFLALRGINMFLTTQDIDSPGGAFWSDEYWHGYLDMMARDRYNLLDIHGPCDAVTLTFRTGFLTSSACRISRRWEWGRRRQSETWRVFARSFAWPPTTESRSPI